METHDASVGKSENGPTEASTEGAKTTQRNSGC